MALKQSGFYVPGYTPPTSFYFDVRFNGRRDMDSLFKEVSGLKLSFGIEQVREGGDNSFIHELPTQPTYSNLVLKRCLMLNSSLDKWCKEAFENFNFEPKDLKISLLGEYGVALAAWSVQGAYPISWELAALNSTANELAIESLELKYRSFKRIMMSL